MCRTLREVLQSCKVNLSVEGCPVQSKTKGHDPLNKRWHPWPEFNDDMIEHYLGPALDDIVDYPEGFVPEAWDLNPRAELGVGNFFDKFYVGIINLAIKHICNKIGIKKPVLMRRSHGRAIAMPVSALKPGDQIKPDWWSGTVDEVTRPSLPGDEKATSKNYLKQCFEDKVEPDQDITHINSTHWQHAKSWLGQAVSYAIWLGVQYCYLLTSHEVVVGRVAACEAGSPTSKREDHRMKQEAESLEKQRACIPKKSENGIPATPTPLEPRYLLRNRQVRMEETVTTIDDLVDIFGEAAIEDKDLRHAFLLPATPKTDGKDRTYESTPRGLVDRPRVEFARIPYRPESTDSAQHPILALVFLHVLASVDREQKEFMMPLGKDQDLLSVVRDRLRG